MSEYILKGKSGIDKQLDETIYKLCETIEEDDARYEARKREIIRVLDLLLKEDDTRHAIRELIELIITRTANENIKKTSDKEISHETVMQLCEPVLNYLKQNFDPYVTIHINSDGIEVTRVICGIPEKVVSQRN